MLIILILPSVFLGRTLRFLGYNVGKNLKVGFSILNLNRIDLSDNVRIGHLNLISIDSLILKANSSISHFNIFKGPFSLLMLEKARIGNQNYLSRAEKGITYGKSNFTLGYNSNITSKHFIDLTKSVSIGNNSVLGGRDSQIWTHGYVHDEVGDQRFRVDGEVNIGNNVYVGSKCFINPGVKITNAVSIGGGTSVAKDLVKKGLYVSQKLRYIEQDFEALKQKFEKVDEEGLIEEVFKKR